VAVLVAAGLYLPRRSKVIAEGKADSVVKTPASNLPSASIDATAARDSIKDTRMNSGSRSAVADAGTTTPSPASPSGPRKAESSVRDGSGTDSIASRSGRSSAKSDLAHLRQKGEVVPAGERDTLSVSAASGQATAMGHDSDPTHSVAIAQAQSDNSKEVEEIERQMDQLASRASSVHDSLENLRRQQAAQGLGLRGDIASTQERMDTYLGKAQAAMRKEDIRGSKKYMELAEPEVEKLEKFLSR
jgi:hypothetical protein